MTVRRTRADISRALAMYGAFTASAVVLDGDDAVALAHLRHLRARLHDERGDAVERAIHDLEKIVREG